MKFHGSKGNKQAYSFSLTELGMAVIYMHGMQNFSPKGVGVRYLVDNGIFSMA